MLIAVPMRRRVLGAGRVWPCLLLAMVTAVSLLGACNNDLHVDQELFACTHDSDCADGMICRGQRCLDPQVCDDYCNQYFDLCHGVVSPQRDYKDFDECLSVCETIPQFDSDDKQATGNSLDCRFYHLDNARKFGAKVHCPHASWDGRDASGSAVCGSGDSKRCLAYCADYMDGCADEPVKHFDDAQQCLQRCALFQSGNGIDIGPTSDPLSCRLAHAVKAFNGNEPELNCPVAAPDSQKCKNLIH